jgi:hypothetical protein
MPAPSRPSSMPTESTRNGMSSEMTWIAVCVDCQPSWSKSGLYARTRVAPGGRRRASATCASAAPYRSSGARSPTSSGGAQR